MEKFRKQKSSRWLLFSCLLAYKVCIEIIYIYAISPLYSYYGLTTEINITSFVLGMIYFGAFCVSIPKNNEFVSTTIYVMIGIFILIPSISYYWLSSQSHTYTFMLLVCFIIISFILRLKKIYLIDSLKNSKKIIVFFFSIYVVSTILIIISQGGFDPRALSFDTIYSLREELTVSSGVGYILNWCVKVFTPFFFAYFYYKKKYGLMTFVLILQLSLYLTFGYKAYLFSIAFLIMCLIINRLSNFNAHFVLFYLGISLVSTLFYLLFNKTTLLNSIPFRMVFVPAQAQYQYYDFFSVNPKVGFADGLIGTILSLESPYSISMFNVISNAYYGDMFSQNTGVFADAYGNGGFIAMLIISFILGIILYLIDISTKNIPNIITISAFSYMVFVLNDNSLLTALLTGGLSLLIVMFYFFNSESEYLFNKKRLK